LSVLLVLLLVLLSLHHWLVEPLLLAGEGLLELGAMPALTLAVLAWLLAGERAPRS
jgi:hypothetical protein